MSHKKRDDVRCAWCSLKGATVPVGTTGQKVHPKCEPLMGNANVIPFPLKQRRK